MLLKEVVSQLQGIYADLVPAWYAQVGQSLTIVIVFTVGLPHPAFVLYRCLTSPLSSPANSAADVTCSGQYESVCCMFVCRGPVQEQISVHNRTNISCLCAE